MGTFGPAYDEDVDGPRVRDQMARVRAVMQGGTWRTLAEIAALTQAPESSVSAQLRHLRKARFGAHQVEKRRRVEGAGTWEYRVLPPVPAGQLSLV